MIEIFLKTLPFFTIIGIGFVSAWRGFFSSEATAYLTKFVFYFALSAMLFRFSARLDLSAVFSWDLVFAYLSALCYTQPHLRSQWDRVRPCQKPPLRLSVV